MANITKLAAAGDSLTDVAGQVGTLCWFDVGRAQYPSYFTATYGSSLPYNVARAGASAQVTAGQHGAVATTAWRVYSIYGDQIRQDYGFGVVTGIAAAYQAGASNSAVIWIGQNDFSIAENDAYDNIYDNTWSDSQCDDYITDVHDAIIGGVDDYIGYAPDGQLLVLTPVSYNMSPAIRALYPDHDKRDRVESVIEDLRDMIKASCRTRRIPVLDMHQIYDDILGYHTTPYESFELGGNTIVADEGGLTNFFAFQDDDVHESTTVAAIHLVAILTAFKVAYGHTFTEPSESTMCGWCTGLATGGANTLNLYYPAYVSAYNLDTAGIVAATQVYQPGSQVSQVYEPGAQITQVAA